MGWVRPHMFLGCLRAHSIGLFAGYLWYRHFNVKVDGTRKSRACLDGSRRTAPWLCKRVQPYASCISQPCMRMCFALVAILGFIVAFAEEHYPRRGEQNRTVARLSQVLGLLESCCCARARVEVGNPSSSRNTPSVLTTGR